MTYGAVAVWCLFIIINVSLTTSQWNKTQETTECGLNSSVCYEKDGFIWKSHLTSSSIIYGLTEVVHKSNRNVTLCSKQMKHLQQSILSKDIWAMKALDASGVKPSGFLFGHNYWLGSREACSYVHRPVPLSLSTRYKRVMHYGLLNETSPFAMDYRVVYLQHNSPWQVEVKIWAEQIIHVGLCVPSVCANTEILQLMTKYIEHDLSVDNHIYEMQPQVLYIKDFKISDQFYKSTNYRMVKGYVIFVLVMVLMAAYVRKTSSKDTKWNTLERFILRFDIVENWSKLYSTHATEGRSGGIPVINGMHSVFALLVIFIHVPLFMYFTANNKPLVLAFAEDSLSTYLIGMNTVDAFFIISGFLQTYQFLSKPKYTSKVQKRSIWQNFQQVFKKLWHRCSRLFPLYVFVMAVASLSSSYLNQMSVFHIAERYDVTCAQYWWRNLLSIQNFSGIQDCCLIWSWTLACEMQIFVAATTLQWIYPKHPKLVKSLVLLVLAFSTMWWYMMGLMMNFQWKFDTLWATIHHLYLNTIPRISPFIFGAIAAWYLVELKKYQINLTERQESLLWMLSLAIFLAPIIVVIKADIPPIYAVTVTVLERLSFNFGICWLIIASATQRGCWLTRLLEAKAFQHFHKIIYALYLVHPVILTLFYNLMGDSIQANVTLVFVLFFGFLFISYLVAVLCSLLFEIPFYDNIVIYNNNK